MGLQSLPVAFGVETAKWITVATIDVTQAAVAAYLFLGLKEPLYGGILTALILPQVRTWHLCCRPTISIMRDHACPDAGLHRSPPGWHGTLSDGVQGCIGAET